MVEFKSEETELEKVIRQQRERQAAVAKQGRRAGFIFDPLVGYVPWGPGGPALESESWS